MNRSRYKIALAGATGNLGPALTKSLLAAGHKVTVLTRSKNSIPEQNTENFGVSIIDWNDPSSLQDAIKDHEVVVSALPMDEAGTAAQLSLINACVVAGVPRYVPSTFGSDFSNSKAASLPAYAGKVKVVQRCRELAKSDAISFVDVACGPYLDWCIAVGLFLDPKNHQVIYYDGGDVPFSTSTLKTVGDALVSSLNIWENVKNRTIRVQDAVVTQKQLVRLAQDIQADGAKWTESHANTEDLENQSRLNFSRGEVTADDTYDQIKRAIWGSGFGGEMDNLDNSLLGLEGLDGSGLRAIIAEHC